MHENWMTTSMPDGSILREFMGIVPCRQQVSNAALCVALGQANLLAQVEALVAQLPFDAPAALLWKRANDFNRADPLWEFFAPQLGLTSEDIDNIFDAAGQVDDSYRRA